MNSDALKHLMFEKEIKFSQAELNERILDIDDVVADALSKAINSEYLFKTVRNELNYVELEDNEYILRLTISSGKKNRYIL